MTLSEYFNLVFTDYTLRTITLGTAILGAICGVLGSFAVLKKQSLLGDAISHASLPGIAIAFLITGTKNTNILLIGALISGLIGAFWIRGIVKNTHLKTDTVLGIILSIFFGLGMLLLGYIQKLPNANQTGLENFLFGQAATLMERDVLLMGIIFVISLIVLVVFWKELKLLLFDADYAQTLGFNTKKLDILITSLIVIAIVLGLQTVGVVLMSAMLLAPAAAARQWTNSLGLMIILAAIFGAFSGLVGTGISASQKNLSTGPIIVLIAFFITAISFVFSPSRGLLIKYLKVQKNRLNLKLFKGLLILLDNGKTTVEKEEFMAMTGFVINDIKNLEKQKFICKNGNSYQLTEKAHRFTEKLLNK